jgi:hypothetical protein
MDKEFKARLKAAEAGESYKSPTKGAKAGQKRKRGGSEEGSSKRRKADDNDDDDIEDDSDIEIEIELADSDAETKSDGGVAPADSSDVGSGEDEEEEEEPVEELSVDELKEKIKETKEAIKVGREQLNLARQQRKEASDAITKAKRDQAAAQKDKNAFCSLKRSAYSQGVLKEDFRTGLKDLDDAAAEERDPNSFDPTIDLRSKHAAFPTPRTESDHVCQTTLPLICPSSRSPRVTTFASRVKSRAMATRRASRTPPIPAFPTSSSGVTR